MADVKYPDLGSGDGGARTTLFIAFLSILLASALIFGWAAATGGVPKMAAYWHVLFGAPVI